MDTATEVITLGQLFLQVFNSIWGVFHQPSHTAEQVVQTAAIATAGAAAAVQAIQSTGAGYSSASSAPEDRSASSIPVAPPVVPTNQ